MKTADERDLALASLDDADLALASLDDADLARLRAQANEIASAAPGVDELFGAISDGVESLRRSRRSGDRDDVASVRGAGSDDGPDLELPAQLSASPDAVVRDQREAMIRSIRLRDDRDQPAAARTVWAMVVSRLARLRRDAKAALAARRRRSDPLRSEWLETEYASQAAALEQEVLTEVPTTRDTALPHLGGEASGGELQGLPARDERPIAGAGDSPTINPHPRA